MINKFLLGGACVAIAAVLVMKGASDAQPDNSGKTPVAAGAPGHVMNIATQPAEGQASWTKSPFAKGAPPVQASLAARIEQRKERMKAKGIDTPPEYNTMDLKTLHSRAKRGDLFAMLQLAEQYAEEADALESDPAFDVKQSPNTLSKKYLADAMAAGHNHSAAVLAKKHAEEHNPVDAYAWHVLSERLGDTSNTTLFRQSNTFGNLSYEQRQLAEQKAAELFKLKMKRFEALGEIQVQR
jgi:hypothetical protein